MIEKYKFVVYLFIFLLSSKGHEICTHQQLHITYVLKPLYKLGIFRQCIVLSTHLSYYSVLYRWKHPLYYALSKPSLIQGNTPRWMSPLRKNTGSQRILQVGEQLSHALCGCVQDASMCKYLLCLFKNHPFQALTTTAP